MGCSSKGRRVERKDIMSKYQHATIEEIQQYIDENYRQTSGLSPSEQADVAGEIANALDKIVYVNGLHMTPDKPEDRASVIGTNIVLALAGVSLFIIVMGLLTLVLSSI
jgi:hypothetical protein